MPPTEPGKRHVFPNNPASYAWTLMENGAVSEARLFLEDAIARLEAAHGPTYPDLAFLCWLLALVLRDAGEGASARAFAERSIAMEEAQHGPGFVWLVVAWGWLGSLLIDLGDFPEAEALLQRATALAREQLPEAHPEHEQLEYLRASLQQARSAHDSPDPA